MSDSVQSAFLGLSGKIAGRVSLPGSEGYVAATSLWAKQTDVSPRAVVHCESAADVQAAIRAAREHGLPLSVRGGGHDWAGRALCNGIVIDLSKMRHVVLGSDHRFVTIAGGARAADVTAVTDPADLAVVAGAVSCVGMTGLTLGGGYGPLIGRFGLALDNMLAAQVVLADGRIVSADDDNNADLFWALRGGGGNFGVVTQMRHRVHDLPDVLSGLLVYPFAEAHAVLEGCASLTASAPDELTVQAGLVADPSGQAAVMLIPTWSGRLEAGEAKLEPFLRLGTVLAGRIERKSYGALLGVFDPYLVNGLRAVMETCSLPVFDRRCIDTFVDAMEAAVSPGCAIFTHEFRGAASHVPEAATAFGLRRDHLLVEMLAMFPDRTDADDELRHRHWARTTRQTFAAALPGGYPNLLGPNDPARARHSYGSNAKRLMEAKHRYDPDNVFSSAIPLPRAL
ncbi:6-hydroxy-D-nicotine oxidase [Bradyrhizobium sacchari]|uniref:FAD/FMN-containing dehydrogenase n=1 Tax=Bradyrhizobium sacchari TaxID=1399419 RepID=A0A560K5M2_9BRAD|nr:FAD-binding oxidoreductase [Bradyrhizobium sacchari]OPY99050.1 6-hydroxy-D-nicotine oxidase [Bradyrhizobium sacchari]TWB63170.1 FAD/FMN-containing dehydrogenase [Bradyrhizobium sacchari]TWB75900.1 FAD/FMN-containing dehydrogenase [Bradyrhizobium sacchari]